LTVGRMVRLSFGWVRGATTCHRPNADVTPFDTAVLGTPALQKSIQKSPFSRKRPFVRLTVDIVQKHGATGE